MELPNPRKPEGGLFYNKVKLDIKHGTIVAYLIDEQGKDLKTPQPFARATARLFIHKKTKDIIF